MSSLSVPACGVEIVKAFEGFRSKVYPDPGTGGAPWTIGYGSTRDLHGNPFSPSTPDMTVGDATSLLQRDMQASATSVARNVQVALSEPCRGALCSFVYNLGETNFKASTLLKKLNASDFQGAADEFPKWNRAGGKVLNGLVSRRAAERKLFLSGVPTTA